MGKERIDAKSSRKFHFPHAMVIRPRGQGFSWAKAWYESGSPVKIEENGAVMVTIKTDVMETTVICQSVSQKNNSYYELVSRLRDNYYLSKHMKVDGYFVKLASYIWIPVDPDKIAFNSGDHLLILVKDDCRILRKGVGSIKKMMKKRIEVLEKRRLLTEGIHKTGTNKKGYIV